MDADSGYPLTWRGYCINGSDTEQHPSRHTQFKWHCFFRPMTFFSTTVSSEITVENQEVMCCSLCVLVFMYFSIMGVIILVYHVCIMMHHNP